MVTPEEKKSQNIISFERELIPLQTTSELHNTLWTINSLKRESSKVYSKERKKIQLDKQISGLIRYPYHSLDRKIVNLDTENHHSVFLSQLTEISNYTNKALFNLVEDNHLSIFQNLIEESRWILKLEKNWDDNGGLQISNELFEKTTEIIYKYFKFILEIDKCLIQYPSINPLPNGSLDFEWDLESARFLINFRFERGEILGFYYGDLHNKRMSIKGNIPIDKTYEHIAKWMIFLK